MAAAEIEDSIRTCATTHGLVQAEIVLDTWQGQLQAGMPPEFLQAAVHALAQGAASAQTVEARADSMVGLERCLSASAQQLAPESHQALQQCVLEQTLQQFDGTGDALADTASRCLLRPEVPIAQTIAPLRATLTVLLRCVGEDALSARELLELVRGDVAVAVAVLSDCLAHPAPAGLPRWPATISRLLHQLTTTDTFTWLLSFGEPDKDFNTTPMSEMAWQQVTHCHAFALCLVQFNVIERLLAHAEDPSQRQVIFLPFFRMLYNLVFGKWSRKAGQVLARNILVDFTRLGYRYLAPFVRKLVDQGDPQGDGGGGVTRLLLQMCDMFSWLLVHAESEQNRLMAKAMRPLASEWALRSITREAPPQISASLVLLAANAGGLADIDLSALWWDLKAAAWRSRALTAAGRATLDPLGIRLPGQRRAPPAEYAAAAVDTDGGWAGWSSPLEEEEEEEEASSGQNPEECSSAPEAAATGHDPRMGWDPECWDHPEWGDWFRHFFWPNENEEESPEVAADMLQSATAAADELEEPWADGPYEEAEPPPSHAMECHECGFQTDQGDWGRGYFRYCWYCNRCWRQYRSYSGEQAPLQPWPQCGEATADAAAAGEQRGAAAVLLQAPARFRCGIGGTLLQSGAVRIPASGLHGFDVAFERGKLERWHRVSGGRCPITWEALNMSEAYPANDIEEDISAWLSGF